METQKIVNLLNGSENEKSKFVCYWQWIKWQLFKGWANKVFNLLYKIKPLWLFWCIYFSYWKYYCYKDYWTIAGANPQRKQPVVAARQVIFKNWASFENCRTEINGTFADYANFINITMPMYNLIEYSESYSDTSGSLQDFKRDEIVIMQMWLMIIMLLYLNIKQILLVIQKTMEQKWV